MSMSMGEALGNGWVGGCVGGLWGMNVKEIGLRGVWDGNM